MAREWIISVNAASAKQSRIELEAEGYKMFQADWVVPISKPNGVSGTFELPPEVFPVAEVEEFLQNTDSSAATMWAFIAKDPGGRDISIAVDCTGQILEVTPAPHTRTYRALGYREA